MNELISKKEITDKLLFVKSKLNCNCVDKGILDDLIDDLGQNKEKKDNKRVPHYFCLIDKKPKPITELK